MNVLEESLKSWSKGPSQTKAITANPELAALNVSVFAQGSYRARTNVRLNSDVDICVRYNDTFFEQYPAGKTRSDFGNIPGTMDFSRFKNLVQSSLEDYFSDSTVTRGNKAFDVHANSYRVDADVVPTFEYRWYTGNLNSDSTQHYHSGVAFDPDTGGRVINWPQQVYDNGVARNSETSRSYKRVIRILKRLKDRMKEEGVPQGETTPSFLIECLVWNAPVEAFSKDTYSEILRHVIADLWNRTRNDDDCREWGEVSEFKYLFFAAQPWTRQQANDFLQSAWDYIGYK